jgi:hypothetical protein
METVYVSVEPRTTGLGAPTNPTTRSAVGGLTCEITIALLFEESKSGWLEVTEADEVIVPVAVGVTTTVIVAVADTGMSPRLQLTTPPERVQPPCEETEETKIALGGNACPTTTFFAVLGPLFVTEIV